MHPVLSTYAIAREFEWAGRKVFLSGATADQNAVGTMVKVEHFAPATEGCILLIEAWPVSLSEKGHLLCRCQATTENGKLIARGKTGQKVFLKV